MATPVTYSNIPPVTVEGICRSTIYTQQKASTGNCFGIYTFEISKVLEGFFPPNLGQPPFCVVKCIGDSPEEIVEGGRYEFKASYEVDPQYGPQLHFMSVKELEEVTSDVIQWEYLATQLTPSAYAKLTAARQNADFDILQAIQDGNARALSTLKGIRQNTAERIINSYRAGLDKLETTVQLANLGFSATMRENIMRQYSAPGALKMLCRELSHNFYAAIGKIHGFSWTKTDTIAQEKHGYTEDCKERIQAYVLFYLDSVAKSQGHSWVDKDELIGAIFEIAPNAQPQRIGEYLSDMLNCDLLFYDRETKRIGSQVLYNVEKDTARQLARLMAAKNWELPNIDYHIKRCEEQVGFEYTPQQRAIIREISENKVTLVTGPAGSGKTNSMFPITEALKAAHKEFRIAALSGKASLNIGEATHSIEQSCTIHRLLGFYKGDRDTEDTAFFDTTEADSAAANGSVVPWNPITHKLCIDLLIIDEVSMIGGYLFRRVVEALPDHAKLVLVGDEGQLEAIGYANVLWDIKRSAVVPYYTLTQIMRQAARSGILSDSLKIYRKEQFIPPDLVRPAVHGELQDFRIVPCETSALIQENVKKEYRAFIEMGISPEDLIVVTQKRAAGALSSYTLNTILQNIVNPHQGQSFIKVSFTDSGIKYAIEFRAGDRVMMIQNDYEVPLHNELGRVAIYNGNMGTVIEAGGTANAPWLIVQFPQGVCRLTKKLITKLQLGYAATCHKLQGSGIPYVIGVVDPSAYTLLTNEALYTEITRAKKYCVLLGSPRIIRKAVRVSIVKKKQTWLAELLREEVEEVKDIDDPF